MKPLDGNPAGPLPLGRISDPAASIWPPPISRLIEVEVASVQFSQPHYRQIPGAVRKSRNVARMNISDFRKGTLKFDRTGLTIAGTAALRAEVRMPVIVASIVCSAFGFWATVVLPYKFFCVYPSWITCITIIVMEVAFRRPRKVTVPLTDIYFTFMDKTRQVVAIVYKYAGANEKMSTQVLSLKLTAEEFDDFAIVSRKNLGDRAVMGSFVSRKATFIWIGVIYAIIMLTITLVIFFIFRTPPPAPPMYPVPVGRGTKY